MSYRVLARKWRPQSFNELVGQDRVLSGLINALNNQSLHHAYLFTGTRGVGKTTVARILAKALNCDQGISATPCGQCDACMDITAGRFMDLIEIDAASRTKVDDTRELLDNIQFAPTSGRFKVYLIDEVHMLSTHSFNALLKTLEEPPEHVKFLLATTDPQKLPITVLSRCLQFHLMNIDTAIIIKQLKHILTQEKITFVDNALTLIAQSAKGSLRDALSLLDQAINHGNNTVSEDTTLAMLGCISEDDCYTLLDAIITHNGNALITHLNTLSQQSVNYGSLLESLIHLLHDISLSQQLPDFRSTQFSPEKVTGFAQKINAECLQLLYQITLLGKRDLPLAPDAKLGLEMVLLRMIAFLPKRQASDRPLPLSTINAASEEATKTPTKPVSAPAMAAPKAEPPSPKTNTPETQDHPNIISIDWHQTVTKLDLSGMAKQFITHCSLSSYADNILTLIVSAPYSNMLNKKLEAKCQAALRTHLQQPIKLKIHVSTSNDETPAIIAQRLEDSAQQKQKQTIEGDKHIQFIQHKFNAKID